MKLSIRIFSLLTLGALLGISMVGCLKDDSYDNREVQSLHGGSNNFVEVKLTAASAGNYLAIAFDNLNYDTTLNFIPVVASSGPVSEDVHVTLTQNNKIVTDYNTANSANLKIPTANMFTVVNPGGVVTIPKGSNTGYLQVKLKPRDYLGEEWGLGYEITAVDKGGLAISGNLKTGLVAILVKNDYEGDYLVTGYFQHPSAPRDIDQEEFLPTAGAKSVIKTLGDLSGTNVILTVNADNTVSIAPGPGTSGTTATVAAIAGDATYNNTYNPTTKTFWLKYGYPQPGPTRIITEKVQRE
ncbi:DUF1735 domain-containing protein [Paraflavitalea sp. CAU 1676]|uniref:BT_3987 domain-containing protein n=1 Tax=Paraflavitalea sp. CAU 1676 TaxID=3032598 RepID=UPI0023DC80F2|nr:DUF1735 domain-containing protein [Paraflavitalea sp. CAU 1676]MDF2193335.1 DUF1735 domain-containing protein [Paraflavitalea sp. CAU 1676]